ncbi:hypothetical protein GCK32_004264 [Trichostrongylus colubriformis]|uniref:MARVEL domain-containing protein n=1 Tax=Trichostrongylus colubriformis TaxID=6319 RepID=A0AAN8FYH1_TRICO
MRLESNIYFYLVVRLLCTINCMIALFCVALSSGWTGRLASVIGLIFTLISLLFIGGAIATLFAWNLSDMSLPKRSLFMLVFILTSVISGVMYLVAFNTCDAYNQYGCFQTYYGGAFRIAAAFSFISVAFAVIDLILNFFFYYQRHAIAPVAEPAPVSLPDPRSPSPSILKKKHVSIVGDDDSYSYSPRTTTGHSTEV